MIRKDSLFRAFVLLLAGFWSCKQSPVVKLHDLKNEMCECDDSACASQVYDELRALKEPENSLASRGEIVAVMNELAECAEKLESSQGPSKQ